MNRAKLAPAARIARAAEELTSADLSPLGFRLEVRRPGVGYVEPNWYRTDGAVESVRVILDGEDGIEVFVFVGPGLDRGVLNWTARFSGCTPAAVVLTALRAAIGR